MDNDTFGLLSQIIVKAKSIVGSIHPGKLVNDAIYAEDMFRKIEQGEDVNLIMLSLQLRQKLGLLEQKITKPQPSTQNSELQTNHKYTFGARG